VSKKVESVMLHVATLPVVVEVKRARRDRDDGRVVVTVKAGKAKRPRPRKVTR